MAYELVMFDVGGVAVEFDTDRLILQVSQLVGQPFEEVQRAVYDDELLLHFELGRMTPQAYYQALKERLRLSWGYEQFVRVWNSIFIENRDVTQLLQRVRKRHKLLALTNTNSLHLEYLKKNFPSLSIFDHWVASCDVGLRKPDPQIYLLALKRAGVRPQAAIYVDDRPELVEAGRGAGLTAIRCESGPQREQALRAVGRYV
jgi:putative hydrolase of the HAD superfamily